MATGIDQHLANVAASEQLRLQAMGPNYLPNTTGVAQAVSIPVPPLPQSVVNKISIDHYRRCRLSAIQNGISPSCYINALIDLGTGGF
jgi:hypothetical protein